MGSIQNKAALLFIISVSVLSLIAICAIAGLLSDDVASKSLETLGVLALATVIVMKAGKYFDKQEPGMPRVVDPIFRQIRRSTLLVLIVSAALLALIGILAIWGVLPSGDFIEKSISIMVVVAFAALIIVMTCLDRERV